jgi:putative tryptophan/tyrosine transport system substrate-binding protein
MSGMGRREFVALLGGAAVWPLAARAQQARMPVLGFLGSAAEADYKTTTVAVRRGLNEAGYVEKQNLLIDYRWADFQYERLPALAAELVKRPVDAIFATGSVVSALAAKAATSSIPIVFANGSDPVESGLVASLSRPGGNVTGVTFVVAELGAKQLGLLHELQPGAVRVGVLVDLNYAPTQSFVSDVQARPCPSGSKSKSSRPPPAVTLIRPLRGLPKSRLMRCW